MTLYLDTSSLVKLYITEPGSDAVQRLVNSAGAVATSVIAYPEARAALARRRREGALNPRDFTSAKRKLDLDWSKFAVVRATVQLCHAAGELAERYRLRGCDSVHLASFIHLARHSASDPVRFSSFDERLNRAARSAARAQARLP